MRPSRYTLLFLGLAATAGLSAAMQPASAMVRQIGAVNVSADHYTDITWSRFEGPVLKLNMVASGDTVDCDHIDVTYRDGTTHTVFSGVMTKDSVETITFPEGDSRIRHVDFACKAQSVDGARIALSSVSEGDRLSDEDWARRPHVSVYESGQRISSD
jgi:hypothetical protein